MCETNPTCHSEPHADIPVKELTAEQCLNVVTHAESIKSYYDSKKAAALARYAELRPPTRPGADLADGAGEEVAIEIGVTPQAAAAQILQAQSIVKRLPATMAALRTGKIDYRRALTINDLTTGMSEKDARTVEERVLDGGQRANANKFRDAVRYQVIKADPEAAERRRTQARQQRNVTFRPNPDGMARLTAYLTSDETMAAHRRITALARSMQTPERPLAQCRADALVDLILGKQKETAANIGMAMNVTVPMTTLMGINEYPGELAGYGPITAEHARELAQNAIWRRFITDSDGEIVEINQRGYFSPYLEEFVQARNRLCRVTGCGLPAEKPDKTDGVNHLPMCKHHTRTLDRPDQHVAIVTQEHDYVSVRADVGKPALTTSEPAHDTAA